MGQNMENELQPLLQKSVPAAYNSEPVNSVGGIHSQIREELFHIKIIEGRPNIEKVIQHALRIVQDQHALLRAGILQW